MWKSGVSRRTQQFLLYREKKLKLRFNTWFVILSTFIEFFEIFITNMVIILISGELATLSRLKLTVYWNKVYDVVTCIHDVTTKFHCVTQIILYIWSCDQKISIPIREVNWENFNFIRTWPNRSFEGSSWFKFSNLGLAVGISLENLEECDKRAKI